MSIIFRFTERGDGGALGPTRPEPSSIEREKSCFRLKFIAPQRRASDRSKYPAIGGITSASWLPARALGYLWLVIVAQTKPATSWTQTALRGVRVGLGG